MGIGNESTFISLAHQACTGRTAGKEIRAQVFWAIFTAYRGISNQYGQQRYSTPLHTRKPPPPLDRPAAVHHCAAAARLIQLEEDSPSSGE